MRRRLTIWPALWVTLLCVDLACAPERRDIPEGGNQGNGDAATLDGGAAADAGPEDAGEENGGPLIREGGIIRPECEDQDGDEYGEGAGCRGPDPNDEDYTIYPGAPEICDGKDNDGDERIDQDADNFQPTPCALNTGLCRGSYQACVNGAEQPCDGSSYPEDYVEQEDRLCDGRDNDCDGEVDEGCECVDNSAEPCPEDSCAIRRCVDGRWQQCIREREPEDEVCDGLDNDCDGDVDEGGLGTPRPCGTCPFEMMEVQTGNLHFCIDRHEASREDASEFGAGEAAEGQPLARPGVLPWTVVSRSSALSACRSVPIPGGRTKELCTQAQWRTACTLQGILDETFDWTYPYGKSYDPERCHGLETGSESSLPTGSKESCLVDVGRGAYDLSGNVREWVFDTVGGPRGRGLAAGGSFRSEGADLSCEASVEISQGTQDLETGFRCCLPIP